MATDRSEESWAALKRAAQRRRSEMLDLFGTWRGESDEDWTARLTHDWTVEFRGVGAPLAVLLEEFDQTHRLSERTGEFEVEREIVRQATLAELSDGRDNRAWPDVMATMEEQMTRAVVAVPLAGMYSRVTDNGGNAQPLSLGEFGVAGHLDEALEASIDDLARRQGLVGFRFSDESWWTEDLITGKEDPQIGQEILDDYQRNESWPWFVIASRVWTCGIAAEVVGVLNAEALIGALVLLDHPPGEYWSEGLPWIPGQPLEQPFQLASDESPPDTEPQVVDGRARRLQTAQTEGSLGASPAELDAGSHMIGPGRNVLARLLNPHEPASLAVACRLALHSAGTRSPEAKQSLAASALGVLLGEVVEPERGPYEAAITEGVRWRAAHEADWPRHRWCPDHEFDPDRWRSAVPTYEQAIGAFGDPRLPFSMSQSELDGHELLHAVQALFFKFSAEQPLSGPAP